MATNISTITINAPLQKVWDVLTKPEFVKQWQYGSELQITWDVGSKIKFVTPWEGNLFEQRGTVLEYKPTEKLRYSLFAPAPDREDIPENYFEMIYSVTAENEQTKLTITQINNRPDTVQEEEQGEENPILKSLKQHAKKN